MLYMLENSEPWSTELNCGRKHDATESRTGILICNVDKTPALEQALYLIRCMIVVYHIFSLVAAFEKHHYPRALGIHGLNVMATDGSELRHVGTTAETRTEHSGGF